MILSKPIYEVLIDRLSKDKQLKKAIGVCDCNCQSDYLQGIRLHINKGYLGVAKKRILKIAYILLGLGNFPKIIFVIGNKEIIFEIEQLITLCPAIAKPTDRKLDRKRKMESQIADAKRFRVLLEKETEKRSAFLLSTSGIYLECHIKKGVKSKIDPNWMIGRSLDEVVGLKTGFYLLMQIQDAYEAGEARPLQYEVPYPDETRQYKGELIPVPETGSVIVLCDTTT